MPHHSRRAFLPLLAAGALAANTKMNFGGAALDVRIAPGAFDIGVDPIFDWIKRAGKAVTTYFGRFPVTEAILNVKPSDGKPGVYAGVTYGSDPALTRISVGYHSTKKELEEDWMLTHEFVHYGFPSMRRRHHWIEEGIASYVEPVARIQAGQMTASKFWGELVRDMPQGLPETGDRGLDNTHTWGRTYWGGAIFCLLADLRIRERTGNKNGLQQALRGILAKGGNIQEEWTIEKALSTGDAVAGEPVLMELYEEMKDTPVVVDLDALWKKLGVAAGGTFDDSAPLAAVRRRITAAI